ncbi:DUF6907 domain-containing protein [Streptomyces wuyuanensis]|uniref:Uncharacterized protein n=1 Tax=Streptomyces wuyuanensis TaxID=1196353 RepID=A0A1H0EFX5_9ACTN|nr:hypothetical protein [Streptomyces wuyuanensis]SDN81220.1 hypothetical protein SAMN05444921_1441 [Streptomyces wuyuanensis]
MSITVPSPDKSTAPAIPSMFRPSGGGLLPGIPAQPSPEQAADAISAQTRLVPAKVGQSGRVQTVYIECPTWCVVDHADRVNYLEDVMHYSDFDVVQVATRTDDDLAHSAMMLNISSDPAAREPWRRSAHLVVNTTGSASDAYLTPALAEELADDLIAFAAQLRHKARQVRLLNQAEGQA